MSAAEAAKIGAVYLALRLCYPVIWAVWGGAKGAPMQPYTWFFFGKGMNLFYCTFPQVSTLGTHGFDPYLRQIRNLKPVCRLVQI